MPKAKAKTGKAKPRGAEADGDAMPKAKGKTGKAKPRITWTSI
jgi:hypothetical protein